MNPKFEAIGRVSVTLPGEGENDGEEIEITGKTGCLATVYCVDYEDPEEAQRLADCWNACHGLDLPPGLPLGILADAIGALDTVRRAADGNRAPLSGELRDAIGAVRDVLAKLRPAPVSPEVKARLEYLRGELEAGSMSYDELHELQTLAAFIEPGDVQLLEAAGVPEFPEDDSAAPVSPDTSAK